jgi:hypothetical protein
MKKKKFLLGLALAATALVALASCDKGKKDKKTSNTESVEVSGSKESQSETGSKDQSSEAESSKQSEAESSKQSEAESSKQSEAESSKQSEAESSQQSEAESSQQSSEESSASDVEEEVIFTVKYMCAGSEIAGVTLPKTITDDTTKTLEQLLGDVSIDGYKFTNKISQNKAGTIVYDVTKTLKENFELEAFTDEELEYDIDSTIYVFYDAVTVYDEIAADQNCILAYDFNDATKTAFTDYPGLSNTTTDAIAESTGEVVIGNGLVSVIGYDKVEGQSNKNDAQMTMSVGDPITSGIVKGTFTIQTDSTNALLFVNFIGASDSEKYQIGARGSKMRYGASGGSDDDSTAFDTTSTFLFYYEIDLDNKALTITVDGKDTAVTCLDINFTSFTKIQFGSTKGAAVTVKVDNIAVTTDTTLETAKASAKKNITAFYNRFKEADYSATSYAELGSEKDSCLSGIDAATTVEGVKAALQAGKDSMNDVPTLVDDAKAEKCKALDDLMLSEKVDDDNEADAQAAVDAGKAAIEACQTVAAVKEAYEAAVAAFDFATAEKISITVHYLTTEVTEVQKVAVGGSFDKTRLTSIPAGKKIVGVYTDENKTSEYTGAAFDVADDLYIELADVTTYEFTGFLAANATKDPAYDGWTVTKVGSVGINPAEGSATVKPDALTEGYVECPKVDKATYITSPILSYNGSSLKLDLITATDGTGNSCDVLVEFLQATVDGEGKVTYTVVGSQVITGVTKDKKTKVVTNQVVNSSIPFNCFRISHSENSKTAGKNIGIYSITGTVTDAQY